VNTSPLPRSIVALALALAPPATLSAAQDLEPTPIVLAPDALVHGEAKDAYFTLIDTGDIDGDGIQDLVVAWYPRPTRFAYQAAVILGRPDWPALAGVSGLSDVHTLGLPLVDNLSPNAPDYTMGALLDANGDGLDDVVVRKDERQAGYPKAREARVYFGKPGWGAIDVTKDAPDLLVRQARVPWTPREAERYQMPDTFYAGDFNGDGRQDLAIGSCGVTDPDLADGSTDVHLYLAPEGGLQRIDLGTTKPDAVIRAPSAGTLAVQLGCGAFAGNADDLNGDGSSDLVLRAWKSGTTGTRSYLVFGRPEWPADAELVAVADVAMERGGNNPGARAWQIEDISGDGHRDLVVDYFDAHGEAQCVLFSGRAFRPEEDLSDCDLRVVDRPIWMAGDVDGDGARDLLIPWEPPSIWLPPSEWRVVRGPFAPGGEVAIGKSSGQGDYVLRVPERSEIEGAVGWWFEDVSGDGRDDALLGTWNADSPTGVSRAGTVAIHVGPLVAGPPAPSPTASPTATSAPSPTATPSLEATPDEPTATEASGTATTTARATVEAPTWTPTVPTTAGRIYLPIGYR